MTRIVLTGAGGALGTRLYPLLRQCYDVRLSDLSPPDWLTPADMFERADLRDLAALRRAFSGADGIVHFGAIGDEDDWKTMLEVSIDGAYNVFEAARLEGVKRVVYASSVHAIGYYPRDHRIGIDEHVRPDSRYGVSKCCGEAIAALYAHKYGIRTTAIRIGNGTFDQPVDERLLSIWISKRDLVQLIRIGLDHPDIIYEIVYGASGNTRSYWDNSNATRLGFVPQDNAEDFAPALLKGGPIEDLRRPAARYQGGRFVELT